MLVLIAWAVALGLAVVVLAVVGYGLVGHLRRFQRAIAAAQAELEPALAGLRPRSTPGRHRAG